VVAPAPVDWSPANALALTPAYWIARPTLEAEVEMELRDRAALVTGAGRGLGAALARELAGAGARVGLVARDEAALRRVAEAIRTEGGEAHVLPGDLGDPRAIPRLAGAAAALLGPVDLLVHNASSLGPTPLPLLADTRCEDLQAVLAVNLLGPFRLTRAILGAMLLRGSGTVVHVTSDASITPYPRWGAYGVSKAALDQLGRIWGAELEGTGVHVISVDPGEMDTAMHAVAMPGADRSRLALPGAVARSLVALLGDLESLPNGARIGLAAGAPAAGSLAS
jgi:NAD(P)-dependent dehydrogenase (short-subunit alcohol dehydrogenase family)